VRYETVFWLEGPTGPRQGAAGGAISRTAIKSALPLRSRCQPCRVALGMLHTGVASSGCLP